LQVKKRLSITGDSSKETSREGVEVRNGQSFMTMYSRHSINYIQLLPNPGLAKFSKNRNNKI